MDFKLDDKRENWIITFKSGNKIILTDDDLEELEKHYMDKYFSM